MTGSKDRRERTHAASHRRGMDRMIRVVEAYYDGFAETAPKEDADVLAQVLTLMHEERQKAE